MALGFLLFPELRIHLTEEISSAILSFSTAQCPQDPLRQPRSLAGEPVNFFAFKYIEVLATLFI